MSGRASCSYAAIGMDLDGNCVVWASRVFPHQRVQNPVFGTLSPEESRDVTDEFFHICDGMKDIRRGWNGQILGPVSVFATL